ncbi:MAG TPA: hypothetical protein P5144_10275 [Thermoanaerobaculia bacterium]|nr:hypothetical protein [Thermoanaerobaculia bacterium]
MGKAKVVKKSTVVRIPKPLHDRLLRISMDRTIRTGKSVSVNTLILEAVERSLATV